MLRESPYTPIINLADSLHEENVRAASNCLYARVLPGYAGSIRDVAQQTYQHAVQRMPTVLMYPDERGVRVTLEVPLTHPAPAQQFSAVGRTSVAAMLRALADAYDAVEVGADARAKRHAELKERLAVLEAERQESIAEVYALQQRTAGLRREIEELKRNNPDIA